METIEYKNPGLDRQAWPTGEWDNEPDKKQWQDEATGLPCLIVRNWSGALCGYVGVSPSHPLYGKGYDEKDVEVHGGLTFADKCQEGVNECGTICHKAPAGEDDVWWFGFDCHHYGDYAPSDSADRTYWRDVCTYRNIEYVESEIKSLASQLKAYPSIESGVEK